jgi:methenyltetrahydrofolate cyclohydrolase
MTDGAFKKVLDAEDFSTGGGSAAALVGAMAAALAAMVARLSLKKDYGLQLSHYNEIILEAEELRDKLLAGAKRDLEAFALVKEAYALPKNRDDQIIVRAEMIENAFKKAAGIPAENALLCKKVLELSNLLKGKSNPAAGSDLEVAGDLAKTALKGCLENIKVNLPSLKDQKTIRHLENQISELQLLL